MAQFTLQQLLLAMSCFAVSFAVLARASNWQTLLEPYIFVLSIMAGIGMLRGRFRRYVGITILVPFVLLFAFAAVCLVYVAFVVFYQLINM